MFGVGEGGKEFVGGGGERGAVISSGSFVAIRFKRVGRKVAFLG